MSFLVTNIQNVIILNFLQRKPERKKWLQKGNKAYKALLSAIFLKRILKDICQLDLFCHTVQLEVYPSMMLKYIPKRQEFKHEQMVARTQLAAIDYNFNIWRDQKKDDHGQPKSDLTTTHQEKKKTLPKNIAKLPSPRTSELVEAHISRFKIN